MKKEIESLTREELIKELQKHGKSQYVTYVHSTEECLSRKQIENLIKEENFEAIEPIVHFNDSYVAKLEIFFKEERTTENLRRLLSEVEEQLLVRQLNKERNIKKKKVLLTKEALELFSTEELEAILATKKNSYSKSE